MAMLKDHLLEAGLAVWHRLEPFVPGVLGAIVAQAIRPGLGLRQRFVQWSVSVIVFHFVSLALAALFGWPQAVGDVVGFFVAFLAFEALHAWQKAAVEAGASAIKDTGVVWRQLLQGWAARAGGAKPDPVSPPTDGEGK